MIQLFISIVCTALLILWFYYAFLVTYNSAPYFPSLGKDSGRALKKYLKKSDNFLDVGCGDGRILLQALTQGAHVTGIDINPFMSWVSRLNLLLHRKTGKVIQANMYTYDYSNYDVIYAYLLIDTMNKVLPIISKTAKPGTIIIANTFKFKDLEPIDKIGKIAVYRLI